MTTEAQILKRIQQRDRDLERLIEKVNGFVYQGDRLNAVLETVRVLRTNKALAARLLDLK